MKKIIISISLLLAFVMIFSPVKINASSFVYGTYVTPYSLTLDVARDIGGEGYLYWDNQAALYPNARVYEAATNLYNCYTYALIYCGNTTGLSDMPNSETFIIDKNIDGTNSDTVEGVFRSQNPCYEYVDFDDVIAGDVAIYYCHQVSYQGDRPIHVGIVAQKGNTLEETYVISKWGVCAIYYHPINECPYRGVEVSLTELGNKDQFSIRFSFARFTHSYSYYNGKADGSGTIQSNTYHKLRCSGCGAFHFEPHEEYEFEALLMTVGNLTTSTQHKVYCECGRHYKSESHTYSNNVCTDCGYSPILLNNVEEEVEDQ